MLEITNRLTAVLDIDGDGDYDGLRVVGVDTSDPEEGWMVCGPWPYPMPLKDLLHHGVTLLEVTADDRPLLKANHPRAYTLRRLFSRGVKAAKAAKAVR